MSVTILSKLNTAGDSYIEVTDTVQAIVLNLPLNGSYAVKKISNVTLGIFSDGVLVYQSQFSSITTPAGTATAKFAAITDLLVTASSAGNGNLRSWNTGYNPVIMTTLGIYYVAAAVRLNASHLTAGVTIKQIIMQMNASNGGQWLLVKNPTFASTLTYNTSLGETDFGLGTAANIYTGGTGTVLLSGYLQPKATDVSEALNIALTYAPSPAVADVYAIIATPVNSGDGIFVSINWEEAV
jgi:hypothetical protein